MASCFNDVKQAKDYYDREGVVCVRSSLSDMGEVQTITARLPLHDDARLSSRKTACLHAGHPLTNVLYGDTTLKQTFKHLNGYELEPGEFPVEYREYKPFSSGMDWHRDLPMYQEQDGQFQVEMVLTVFNNDTETRFEWVDSRGTLNSIVPSVNDMVFVKPNGPYHRVLPLGENSRGIIKMVAHRQDAVPLAAAHREKMNCPMV
jgi:hypothetical protein